MQIRGVSLPRDSFLVDVANVFLVNCDSVALSTASKRAIAYETVA